VNQVKPARASALGDMTRCAFHAINNVKQAALMVWNMTVSRVAHTPDRPARDHEAPGAAVHAKTAIEHLARVVENARP
jgi:hypothetical protein